MRAALALLATTAALGEVRSYTIAPRQGEGLRLEVYKTGLMRGKKHVFRFDAYSGRLEYDADRPREAKLQLRVDSARFALLDDWVSEKDRKTIIELTRREMLDVERFPEMVFQSVRVEPLGAGAYRLEGTLAIKGIAKPVRMEAKESAPLRFEGSAEIDMTQYGLKPPSAALGMVGTNKIMRLSFVLTAVPGA